MTPENNFASAARTEPRPDADAIHRTHIPAFRYPMSPCGQPPGNPPRGADPHNLVLEHLQKIQADLAGIKASLGEHTMQLGRLEVAIVNLRRASALGETASAEISVGIDQLGQRVERIERRLEIAEWNWTAFQYPCTANGPFQ